MSSVTSVSSVSVCVCLCVCVCVCTYILYCISTVVNKVPLRCSWTRALTYEGLRLTVSEQADKQLQGELQRFAGSVQYGLGRYVCDIPVSPSLNDRQCPICAGLGRGAAGHEADL
jgi:hypothetical protein